MLTKWAVVALQGAVVIFSFAIGWRWMSPNLPLPKDELLPQYDYVIVGAGSAGAILAARLSEDPDVMVALLEAGPHHEDFPELSYSELQKSDLDWAYKTVPHKYACYSIENQRATLPSGRMLGGTSGLNGVMAISGSHHDYDRWAAMGNDGWSYEHVLPYFKKIQTVTDKKNTEIDGARQSIPEAYLKPAVSRGNLHILTNAHGKKVLFEEKRTIGLQYIHNGRLKSVGCRKEVILSAGTFGSPQILLLSGVGPKEHLKEIGIPLVADLPVGKNLHDHVHVHAALVTLEKPAALFPERLELLDKLKYHLFAAGAYSHAGPIDTAFSHSKHQPDSHHNPYVQYVLLNRMLSSEGQGTDLNVKTEVHEALYGGLDGRDGLDLLLVLQQQASVGCVRLNSANPFDQPIINPNYLAKKIDVDVLLDGIRISRNIMRSESFIKKVGAKLVERIHPNCANETYDSDEYWRCYIRSNTLSFCHPTSTCRMGRAGDANAVVDPRLRVHGLDGLRVVDASVMPVIPSGNTYFPTMMIAERAADLINEKISVVTLNAMRLF